MQPKNVEKQIYKTGGAHSIAALTYGTKTFKKVIKLLVQETPMWPQPRKSLRDVGIDMIAGPSEVSIVADKNLIQNG